MIPCIAVNCVMFVNWCLTLICPLAAYWYFLVKNLIQIYRSDFNGKGRDNAHELEFV